VTYGLCMRIMTIIRSSVQVRWCVSFILLHVTNIVWTAASFDKLHSPFLCSFSFQYIWLNHLSLEVHATHCKVVVPNTFWFSDIDTPYSVCLQYIVMEHWYEWHLYYLYTSQPWTCCIQQWQILALLASWISLTEGHAFHLDGVCLQHWPHHL
jgi:hypothetical protein